MSRLTKKTVGIGLSGLASVLVALATACSSSSTPPPCNENPFECTAGQTCWVTDTAGDYACLNSGPGQAGATCSFTVNTPTCGDGLICLTPTGLGGTCVNYCDPTNTAHACPGGQVCEAIQGMSFHVCSGVSTVPADAGAG